MPGSLDDTQVACWEYGPVDQFDGTPHVCGLPEGHDGPHECCCGAEWEGVVGDG
jgi:hypothetical protein